MAILRCAALDEKSLFDDRGLLAWREDRHTYKGNPHLRDVGHITDTGRSRDLRCIRLVPIELGIDILRYLWKRIASVLRPEEILAVKVVRLFLQLAVFR